MFGEKILLYTPLLKWYLEHGLIISEFYEAIEYDKNVCFKKLGESIADARRAGDVDISLKIIAETMKLIVNSLYGVMKRKKHVGMSYTNDPNVTKRINDLHFKDLNQISEHSFELLKCFQVNEKLRWMFLFKLAVLFMIKLAVLFMI